MGFKDTFFSRNLSINCHGNLIDFSEPLIMGILNITPDSFYDGGIYTNRKSIREHVHQMIQEGADVIDAGAFSSRPGAQYISEKEELNRLLPALEIIRHAFPSQIISVDTFRSTVAHKVISEFKIDIINDITAGSEDPGMFDFIGSERIPYILMHMQGTPETMQLKPRYVEVVDEVLWFLQDNVQKLLEKGAHDIIIDPGFGFGKILDHNYALLRNLDVFKALELPLLVGLSRKAMTYKYLGIDAGSALNGTTALHMFALMKGANILRVHDVKQAVEVKRLFMKLKAEENE